MRMSKELERLISDGGTADRIEMVAREEGMKSLWESGLRHVLNGNTTVDELLRVTDVPAGPMENGGSPLAPGAPVAPAAGLATAGPAVAAPQTVVVEAPTQPSPTAVPVDLTEAFELLDDDVSDPRSRKGHPTQGREGPARR